MGYDTIDDDKLNQIVKKLKDLADIKKTITDEDIQAIIINKLVTTKNNWKIIYSPLSLRPPKSINRNPYFT